MEGECECCGEVREVKVGKYVVHGRVFVGPVCDGCNCTRDDLVEIFGEDRVKNELGY